MCDYPLNLSILIRGGKETNRDSLSSGERKGMSPAPNPPSLRRREMWRLGMNVPGSVVAASPPDRGC